MIKDEFDTLAERLTEIVALVIPEEKKATTRGIFMVNSSRLYDKIKNTKESDIITREFKHFVNNIMSTIEALGIPEEQFKSIRRLIQNEIYGCLNEVILPSIKEKIEVV